MEAALHARSLLAAGLLQPLSENSRPGHQLSTLALYPGIGFINSNTATGLRVCLYDDGRGSRDTGKERDAESGLDYLGARYYGSALGRFTSPDPIILTRTRLLDTQGLNRYSYVRNRSTIAIDDGGLGTVLAMIGATGGAAVSLARIILKTI
jgi:RHS repeat-associated protein